MPSFLTSRGSDEALQHHFCQCCLESPQFTILRRFRVGSAIMAFHQDGQVLCTEVIKFLDVDWIAQSVLQHSVEANYGVPHILHIMLNHPYSFVGKPVV